jgi:hypothetical protein
MYGSLLLALMALIGGLAWGYLVKVWAEREARDMAKACAEDYIKDWMAKNAPGIIQKHVEFLQDATLGSGNDAEAADEIGKEA